MQRMIMKGRWCCRRSAASRGRVAVTRSKLDSPAGGEQIVESTYRYEGTKEVDGRTYAVFRPTLKMTFAGKDGVRTKVKEQDSSGEILFDPEAGRLHSATLKQRVTMDVTVAGQTVEQEIDQTIEVKLTPTSP